MFHQANYLYKKAFTFFKAFLLHVRILPLHSHSAKNDHSNGGQARCCTLVIPGFRRLRERVKASPGYPMSSRPACTTKWDPVSKKRRGKKPQNTAQWNKVKQDLFEIYELIRPWEKTKQKKNWSFIFPTWKINSGLRMLLSLTFTRPWVGL